MRGPVRRAGMRAPVARRGWACEALLTLLQKDRRVLATHRELIARQAEALVVGHDGSVRTSSTPTIRPET